MAELFEEEDEKFLIGTKSGLFRIDAEKESDENELLLNKFVTTIYKDDDGILWIGTTGGLNRIKEV